MTKAKHAYFIKLLLVLTFALLSSVAGAEGLTVEEDIDLLYENRSPKGHRLASPIASFFIPGLGQAFNQDYAKGIAHFSIFSAFAMASRHYETDEAFDIKKSYYHGRNEKAIYINRDRVLSEMYSTLNLNTSFYSSFDAYREATLSRDDVPYGRIPVSDESLTDLALAPFNPHYLTDPYVIAPFFIASFIFIIGKDKYVDKETSHYVYERDTSIGLLRATSFVRHTGVSIGEEAFFRGTLNTEAVRYLGPAVGIIVSSSVFGLMHSGVGATANSASAFAYGAYLGYVQLEKKGKLGYNVALHYWWNIAISMYVIEQSKEAEVNIPILSMEF